MFPPHISPFLTLRQFHPFSKLGFNEVVHLASWDWQVRIWQLLILPKKLATSSDGSRSKCFDLGRVGSGWVSHLRFGFRFGKFPPKMSIFSIFPLRIKKNLFGLGQKGWSVSYLLRVKSKLRSGQGPSLATSKAMLKR